MSDVLLWVLLGAYVVSCLVTMRYIIGFFLAEFDYEGFGIIMGLLFCLLLCWAGPLFIAGWYIRKAWVKYVPDDVSVLAKVFPDPADKKIESYTQRQKRLRKAAEDELEQHKRWVKQREGIYHLEDA